MNNKKVFLTGAGGFLGKSIAIHLLKKNFHLILVDKFFDEKFVDSYKNNKCIDFYLCDFISESDRNNLINTIKANHSIDILINNAAYVGDSNVEGWNCDFHNQSLNTFRDALEVNLISPFHFVREFSKPLNNCKLSSVINISSIYGTFAPKWHLYESTGMNNPAAYGTSKSGLNYLTKWLSSILAPIKVNTISLGGIFRKQPNNFVSKYNKITPLKRMAKEEDVLSCIDFLISDETNYITGQNIFIDGGWSI